MAGTLRDQLIGAWTLVSYVEQPIDDSAPFYPMSQNPVGLIIYTADGYMSAQLMKPGRRPFESGDWFSGTDLDYIEEARKYIAYSGPFYVDEVNQTLTHAMFVSLFPNWSGQTQSRRVSIEKGVLHLSTASPIKSSGRVVNSHLHWERAPAR